MRTQAVNALVAGGLLFGASCTGHWPAPTTAGLFAPEGISVAWDPDQGGDPERYNLLYPLSVTVVDLEDFVGLNSIEVNFYSPSSGIYLLPESVIKVAVPESEDGTDLTTDPESGWYDSDPEDGYPFAEFIGEFEDDYEPTYYQGVTDNRGVATVWLWIEDMPLATTETGEVSVEKTTVLIDIGVQQEDFEIGVDG